MNAACVLSRPSPSPPPLPPEVPWLDVSALPVGTPTSWPPVLFDEADVAMTMSSENVPYESCCWMFAETELLVSGAESGPRA